jgi:hypothetical protein
MGVSKSIDWLYWRWPHAAARRHPRGRPIARADRATGIEDIHGVRAPNFDNRSFAAASTRLRLMRRNQNAIR